MKTTLIKIGNSRGIRIPKSFIKQANLGGAVELLLDNDEVVIRQAQPSINEEALFSEKALSDWLREEEGEAWKDL